MARVAHSGMTADEVTENIEAAVQTVVTKLRMVRTLFYIWLLDFRLITPRLSWSMPALNNIPDIEMVIVILSLIGKVAV